MLFRSEEFLMKPKVTLYNNIARSGKCRGRLLVELEIYPVPRIVWEFETLGITACEPKSIDGVLDEPLIGSGIRIEKPYISNTNLGFLPAIPRVKLKGGTFQVLFRNLNFSRHSFTFFLPNARFQDVNLVGQGHLERKYSAILGEKNWEAGSETAGRFIIVPLDEDWQIILETRREALDWLKQQQGNIGTFLTTAGNLYQIKKYNQQKRTRLKSLPLDEAITRLFSFSLLLSFANGGYLGPLYIEANSIEEKAKPSAAALAIRTTPLEQVGISWLAMESDLVSFLKRFSTFERMGKLPYWKDEFDLILSWYFQAIQPQNAQIGKPLPVVANAVGAALERLCVIVLVNECAIRGLQGLPLRLNRLLEQIGIELPPF